MCWTGNNGKQTLILLQLIFIQLRQYKLYLLMLPIIYYYCRFTSLKELKDKAARADSRALAICLISEAAKEMASSCHSAAATSIACRPMHSLGATTIFTVITIYNTQI